MTTNGHDRGLRGVPLRPDHAAQEARTRWAGCVFLVVGVILAVLVGVCGGVVGVMVFR